MIVEEEWVLAGRGIFKIPHFPLQKVVILRMNPQLVVKRDIHVFRGVLPGAHLGLLQVGLVSQGRKALGLLLLEPCEG